MPDVRTGLSAVLLAAALPPWDLGGLVWIALVPWLSRLRASRSIAEGLVQGFWLGFLFALLAAPWLATAIHEFLAVPWPVAVVGFLVFAALLAQPHLVLFGGLFVWAAGRCPRDPAPLRAAALCIVLALAYCGLEWLTPRLFDVGLGVALHEFANLRQLADLGGLRALTGLVVLVNLLVWRIVAGARRFDLARKEVAVCAGLVVVCGGGAFLYGLDRNRGLAVEAMHSDWVLRAGVVQGSVPNAVRLAWGRGDERAAEKQLSTYMLLTEAFVEEDPPRDLVVWPEATFPGVFQQPMSKLQRGRANKFDRQVLRLQTPIVFGSYDLVEEDGRPILYNALYSITPNYARAGHRGFVQRYHKHELLPFAETIPGLADADWVRLLLPGLGLFGRGSGAEVLRIVTPGGRSIEVSPFICSESLHAQHVIEGVRKGARLLLNIGSDGWFGDSGGPRLHLAIARFRSIETRRPQLRAANTGISALILPDGSIVEPSAFGESTIARYDVPIGPERGSRLVEWGDWFGPVSLVASALLIVPFVVGRSRSGDASERNPARGDRTSDPND